MSDGSGSLNPAASKSRMYVALVVLVVLGLASWFTIGADAVFHFRDREVELRWVPVVVSGLFGFRIVMAHMRARMETKGSEEG
ncbi:MAG: hypothetical protein V4555_15830 [Acidobacteriota bacterium]